MTLDDLKSCKTDEQGRPMVRQQFNRRWYDAVVLCHSGEWVWLVRKDGSPYTSRLRYCTPVPASPHADLVRRLGCTVQRLVSQGHYEDARAVKDAADALEGE